MPGEFDFIDWIRSQQKPGGPVLLPAGDDMAAMRWRGEDLLLVGVDQVLEGVHFDLSVHSPRMVGRKVMNRNLSDCAAMACLPAGAVATVALPHGTTMEFAKELYLGIREAGEAYDCPMIGGDTAAWDGRLAVTLTILGRSGGIEPITRRGAKAGDLIYVTGPLGGSLHHAGHPELGRHMSFTPPIELARELAGSGRITAMIDISDGLSRDLAHICSQSHVGAVLQAGQIPIHGHALTWSGISGQDALSHALHDGEDHELLLTASAPLLNASLHLIGRTTAEPGIFLESSAGRIPLPAKAWEHRF